MPERGRVWTGARCRFTLNGVVIGFAVNITAREEIQYDPIEAVDNIEVLEHVPVAYRASMTASQVRIVSETVRQLGFYPAVGKTAEEHLLNILNQEDIIAQLEDRKTSVIVARVFGVKLATRDFTVNARGIVNEDLTFVAIRIADELETV